MPIYEYECLECGHVSEHRHKPTERLSVTLCPHCERLVRVKKLISASTFILKGSGWATTGYQKET